MKSLFTSICIMAFFAMITSCEKDEGKLPNISFKTGAGYVSTNASIQQGSTITIGIDASKAEEKDPLKKFNISKSVNGGADATVYDKDLSGSEGDAYSYDYTTALETTVGQINKYTFTVTNRDGLVNQVTLTVTISN